MQTEIKLLAQKAETVYINDPQASYGIFCYNSSGDLFLNSDYGFYGFAWRSYGEDFRSFLAGTNEDYIYGKFEINHRHLTNKGLPKHCEKPIKILLKTFIGYLKKTPNSEQGVHECDASKAK